MTFQDLFDRCDSGKLEKGDSTLITEEEFNRVKQYREYSSLLARVEAVTEQYPRLGVVVRLTAKYV